MYVYIYIYIHTYYKWVLHLFLFLSAQEKPDVWIEPSKSKIVQIKAAEIITSDKQVQYQTNTFIPFIPLKKDVGVQKTLFPIPPPPPPPNSLPLPIYTLQLKEENHNRPRTWLEPRPLNLNLRELTIWSHLIDYHSVTLDLKRRFVLSLLGLKLV